VNGAQPLRLVITLPLRNPQVLTELIDRLYDPSDPMYHRYLSPAEFATEFGPTRADYDAVIAFVRARGLKIADTYPNRAILDVTGTASAVEAAFDVRFYDYKAADGRVFYAADSGPALPASIAALVTGVLGMDNAFLARPAGARRRQGGNGIGTGHYGGLAPSDIKTAYDLNNLSAANNGVTPDGSGQTLGLLELDTFVPGHIQTYETYYHLPKTKLIVVNIDGGVGYPNEYGWEGEVELDIEMLTALAPKVKAIYVYQAPNNNWANATDILNRMATDNLAHTISCSWLYAEDYYSNHIVQNAEAAALQEMAAQGQSFYAASGDWGASDNYSSTKSVWDMAAQPYACAVGGTTLSVVSPGVNLTYKGEIVWNNSMGVSGGGVSSYWTEPGYQAQVHPENNGGSDKNRNVPDVALNADCNSGFDIYTVDGSGGSWQTWWGTSASSPLWAAFTALVNQGRAQYGLGTVGFVNPMLYGIYAGQTSVSAGAADFHDITTGNNSGYDGVTGYKAGPGYDNTTGLGSFDGGLLFYQMVEAPQMPAKPLPPTGVLATPGDTTVLLTWSQSLGAAQYFLYQNKSLAKVVPARTLSYKFTGLTDGATYSYQIIAQNAGGNSDYSLAASAAPAVVGITSGPAAAPTSGQATITWTTNVLSNASVSWGLSASSLTTTVSSATQSLNHSILLTGLPTTSGTSIYYTATSKDDAGKTVTSSVSSFKTP
jgi:kumamolisin